MALRLDIQVDTSALQRRLDALGADAPRAVVRALNRTAASVQTQAVRALATEVGLKQTEVRKAMAVRQATRDRPTAAVIVTGKRIPLLAFGARATRKGITYRIGTGGRKLVPSGFLATMRSGHRGAFKRKGKRRLPIAELFGPSLPHVAVKAKIMGALRSHAATLLGKNLEHETGFLLSRRRSA